MDEIIRAEFEKTIENDMPMQFMVSATSFWWFKTAWKKALAWKEEQEQMSEDSLEQTKQEAELAGGLG